MAWSIKLSASLSSLVSWLLIVCVVYFVYSQVDAYALQLFSYGECNAQREDGSFVFKEKGGNTSNALCVLHPLFLTDKTFRNNALMAYSPTQMINAAKNIASGTYQLPGMDLVAQDPILANMILNPWFVSDDPFNSRQYVLYNDNLTSFTLNNTVFNNFTATGLKLGVYTDPKTSHVHFYFYLDNNVIMELPIQLYLQKLPPDQQNEIKVKEYGIVKSLKVTPINITTLDELKRVLEDKFYRFAMSIGDSCNGLDPRHQQGADSKCKFFPADALGALVTTFKRVIAINLPENVRADFINYVQGKIDSSSQLDYLEFFLWLAMLSVRDKVTYTFLPSTVGGSWLSRCINTQLTGPTLSTECDDGLGTGNRVTSYIENINNCYPNTVTLSRSGFLSCTKRLV